MNSASEFLSSLLTQHMARLASVARRRTSTLSATAAEEILSASLLAAWERRESFDASRGAGAVEGSLLAWFDGLVRNEKKRFFRKELPAARSEALALLMVDTETAAPNVQRHETLAEAIAELSPKKQEAVAALAEGYSVRQVAQRVGLNHGEVRRLKKDISRRLMSDMDSCSAQTTHTAADPDMRPLAPIDRQIAALTSLEFPPYHGQECPVCLRCTWWEGLREADRTLVRAEIVDVEVREARDATYARKLLISAARRGERIEPTEPPATVEAAKPEQAAKVDISHCHGVGLAERIINETEEAM